MEKQSDYILPYAIPNTDLILCQVTKKDIPSSIDLLTKTFIELEPITMWMKDDFENLYNWYLTMQNEAASKGPILSVLIKNREEEIVASSICLPYILEEEDNDDSPDAKLIMQIRKNYKKYYLDSKHEGKIMHVTAIGVIDKAKGNGLVNSLYFGMNLLGKQNGFTWCISDPTHDYSSKICKNLGMTKVSEILYDQFEYITENGQIVHYFGGIDKFFTEILNKRRIKEKQLANSARSISRYEGTIDLILCNFQEKIIKIN